MRGVGGGGLQERDNERERNQNYDCYSPQYEYSNTAKVFTDIR